MHLPAFGSVGAARTAVKSMRRPNILFIVVDGVAGYSSSSWTGFRDIL